MTVITTRVAWIVAILLIIACSAPSNKPASKQGEYVERSSVTDAEYIKILQKEKEEALERQKVEMQERNALSMKIIFGLAGFLGTLILTATTLQISTNRSLYRAVNKISVTMSTVEQWKEDMEKMCDLRHNPDSKRRT